MPDIHHPPWLILIFSSYNCPADSRNSYIPCRENHQFIGSFYCINIVNKIAVLFFYDNKFPTIPAQCMPNYYGDPMGTAKHSKLLILGSGPAGIHRGGLCRTCANLQPVLITGMEKGGQLTTTTEVEKKTGQAIRTISPVRC